VNKNINNNDNNNDIIMIMENISLRLNISREEEMNNMNDNKFDDTELILLQASEKVYKFLESSLNNDNKIKNAIESSNTLIENDEQNYSLNCFKNMNLVKSFNQEDNVLSIEASTYNINNYIRTENNSNDNDKANNKSYINNDIHRLENAQNKKKVFNFNSYVKFTISSYFSNRDKYDLILISIITCKLFKTPIRKIFVPGVSN